MLALNPWALLAGVVGFAALTGGVGYKSYRLGQDSITAKQAREDQIRMETLQIAQLAAAEEIAKISVTHTTIRQKAETVIRERIQYRDCINDPAVVGLLDAARENRPPSQPPGDRVLSGAGTSPPPDVR